MFDTMFSLEDRQEYLYAYVSIESERVNELRGANASFGLVTFFAPTGRRVTARARPSRCSEITRAYRGHRGHLSDRGYLIVTNPSFFFQERRVPRKTHAVARARSSHLPTRFSVAVRTRFAFRSVRPP